MSKQTGMQASAQAGIEDFNGIFQERLRGIARDGMLAMFVQEVTSLCGETYRPTASVHRRAGSEMVTIQTTSGKESISKQRVREALPSGLEREVRLKSYDEVKRRKGMFDEVLEASRRQLRRRETGWRAARGGTAVPNESEFDSAFNGGEPAREWRSLSHEGQPFSPTSLVHGGESGGWRWLGLEPMEGTTPGQTFNRVTDSKDLNGRWLTNLEVGCRPHRRMG